eukprot:TRINITY_DN183_c3_g1_i3.p1 TRINITY_DN183_c3_g1~~TRINITY_DN183_c3_g1_i3.p1  ORF type:complete len:570 (-),score=216.62 TRINITY_DN183_c3_g1_i3:633-2342(-)
MAANSLRNTGIISIQNTQNTQNSNEHHHHPSSQSQAQPQPLNKEIIIADRFKLIRKIGAGSFGAIYLSVNIITNDEVAVKLESVKAAHPQLLYEAKLYQILAGSPGIPRIHTYGQNTELNYMVMDLLGPSLEDLFNFCGRKFSLKTILMIADQTLRRIEFLHSKNFIHRDIKPENFLVGAPKKSNVVHLIDLGLAKKYRDPKTHAHIQYRDKKSLTGTARYASIRTHLGIEQSRRDDLESLGYVLIYFCRGNLPWQGLKGQNKKNKYDKISEKKLGTVVETLCKSFPSEFSTFLNYSRTLRFADKPDYAYLRGLFKDLFIREGYEYDGIFDWMLPPAQREILMRAENSDITNEQEKIMIETKSIPNVPYLVSNRNSANTLQVSDGNNGILTSRSADSPNKTINNNNNNDSAMVVQPSLRTQSGFTSFQPSNMNSNVYPNNSNFVSTPTSPLNSTINNSSNNHFNSNTTITTNTNACVNPSSSSNVNSSVNMSNNPQNNNNSNYTVKKTKTSFFKRLTGTFSNPHNEHNQEQDKKIDRRNSVNIAPTNNSPQQKKGFFSRASILSTNKHE